MQDTSNRVSYTSEWLSAYQVYSRKEAEVTK